MRDLQKLVGSLSKSGAISGFLGGVAGGGLTSMVASKKGRKTGKKALKYGALAAVGGLAWKAYKQYSANNQAVPTGQAQTQTATNASGRTFDFTPAALPQESFEHVVEDDNESGQLLLMRAMITAAYADGHIDDSERQRIFAQVEQMDLTVEEKATLFDELRQPQSMSALVAQVPDAQTGIEVYAASATAIDLSQPASSQYLQQLASNLCIPNELVTSIHQQLQNA